MELAARLLSVLSHQPDAPSPESRGTDDPLALLNRVFSGFEDQIRAKTVLDFGCGAGLQSVAMARLGAKLVLGLDTNPKTLAKARELAVGQGLEGRLQFADAMPRDLLGSFDLVISQNSMEHFREPAAVLEHMKAALRPGGRIMVTFGPPWLAPYGSHMRFFIRIPWVNLLFSESAVMKVRSRFVQDGALRYEDVEGGLNRMTVGKFERIVAQCGLHVSRMRYDCVKGLGILGGLPVVRELFVNHVSCVLEKRAPSPFDYIQ